jgi:hypothetical protein
MDSTNNNMDLLLQQNVNLALEIQKNTPGMDDTDARHLAAQLQIVAAINNKMEPMEEHLRETLAIIEAMAKKNGLT